MRHLFVFVFICILFSFSLSADWWDRKCEGWFYFEERPRKAKKVDAPQEKEKIDVPEDKISAKEELENRREELEEKLANFILDPSKENAIDYLKTQKMWIDKSHTVQRHWEMALLENPSLDYRVSFPVSQYGLNVSKEIEQQKIKESIEQVASEYILAFFYRGEEKFSQAFAKIIKLFSDLHKWKVVGVANDDVFLDEIPSNKKDDGLSEKFGVKGYPAVFYDRKIWLDYFVSN